MGVFQTTSPSYILSASIDAAVRYLASDKGKLRLRKWYEAVRCARERLSHMTNLTLFQSECCDVSKLVICGAGVELSDHLRRKYKIELEMASLSYVIAMTGMGDNSETLDRFTRSLLAVDGILNEKASCPQLTLKVPRQVMIPTSAMELDSEYIPLCDASGRIAADYVYAYPPGVPMIIPGELCDSDLISSIEALKSGNVSIKGIKSGKIKVIKE